MATDPQMAAQGAAPAPEGADTADTGESGYCIEIHVKSDGTISVGVESEADETAEDQGTEDQGSEMPVKSIKDALSMALDIFKNGGEMQSPGADMEQMSAGYTGQKAPKSAMAQGGM